MTFNLLDGNSSPPSEVIYGISTAMTELKGHPVWPLFVELLKRERNLMLQASCHRPDEVCARLAGFDDAIEVAIGIPDQYINWAQDQRQTDEAQRRAREAAVQIENTEPHLSM